MPGSISLRYEPMNRPKANLRRIGMAGLGAVIGYTLCGFILEMIAPSMDVSVIRFFSALTGLVYAAVAWKIG